MRVHHRDFTTFFGMSLIRLGIPDTQPQLWPSDWPKHHSTHFWPKYLASICSFSHELYINVAPRIPRNSKLSGRLIYDSPKTKFSRKRVING